MPWIYAKYDGKCAECHDTIFEGDRIWFDWKARLPYCKPCGEDMADYDDPEDADETEDLNDDLDLDDDEDEDEAEAEEEEEEDKEL